MKNIYSRQLLERVYEQYQKIKNDFDYLSIYSSLISLHEINFISNIFGEPSEEIRDEVATADFELRQAITKRWGLHIPVSLNLKIKREDLLKPKLRAGSPLATLIYAFGVDANPLLAPKRLRKRNAVQILPHLDKKELKFMIFSMHSNKQTKYSCRKLGRLFSKDHKTVMTWIEEVQGWSQAKKEKMRRQLITSKKAKNIDAYSISSYDIIPLGKIEYKLTDDGAICSDGRKRTQAPDVDDDFSEN